MKWMCTMSLMAALLLAGVPATQALQATPSQHYQEGARHRKKKHVPEGSGGVILGLTAAAVGGGLIIWRRKRQPAL